MILMFVITMIVGIGIGFLTHRNRTVIIERKVKKRLQSISQKIASKRSSHIENVTRKRERLNEDIKDIEKDLAERQDSLDKRQEFVKQREITVEKKKLYFDAQKKVCDEHKSHYDQLSQSVVQMLLRKTGKSIESTQSQILNEIHSSVERDKEFRLLQMGEEFENRLDDNAYNLITGVLQRYTLANAQRMKFDPIRLPKKVWDKHREVLSLIESISEVEFDYNEEEEGIYVNYYNLVRRAIAHEALLQVVKSKSFDEKSIKQNLKRASEKIHAHMMEMGRKAFRILSIPDGKYPDELIKLTGRMYYRTSFGQNVLEHSIEVAFFGAMLAGATGYNVEMVKEAGLFHDIGKAIDQETEGGHDYLTKQILEEYNLDPDLIHIAWNHHDAIEMEDPAGRIVQAADAISATRPGARAESGEQVSARIHMLEGKAYAIEGIKKAYALSAGRELRAIFDPKSTNDEKMHKLIQQLATNIEQEGGYPGQVMVHGIRELKITENANVR